MQRLWKQPVLTILLLLAALTALVGLGWLQYRLVEQVSTGEHERMQANLYTNAARFREDFDREIARTYLSFQLDAETLRDQDWERFADRYDRWQTSAPYAALVESVYLVRPNAFGSLELLQYEPQQRTFLPVTWPPNLTPIWLRLAQANQASSDQRTPLDELLPEPIASNTSALLIPLARTYLLTSNQAVDIEARFIGNSALLRPTNETCLSCEIVPNPNPSVVYTVVKLNQRYITETMVPMLMQRSFAANNTLDYHVAIVQRDNPQTVIYNSAPVALTDQMGDAQLPLFSVRRDELQRLLVDNSVPLDDQRRTSAGTQAVTISVVDQASAGSDELRGVWTLIVTHREGSLDAAVARLRTHNLILGFSTLLILALSLILGILLVRHMQRLAQQKLDFVTAVSHELRTPLAVICSAGDNLANGIVRQPEQLQQYGSVIRSEGQRLSDLVERVLAFAGVQAGRKRYGSAPVDLQHVLERVLHSEQLNLGDFTIERQIAPDLPFVRGDAAALGDALHNLIANAMKYSGDERWLRVSASEQLGHQGSEIWISIEDRGIGISPIDVQHIFEPFYRAHSVMTAQIRGSGLGLALVKHTIEAHGGRITVESTLGVGSRFTLTLPVLMPVPEERQKAEFA
jgi:signal transduction histidine kinase